MKLSTANNDRIDVIDPSASSSGGNTAKIIEQLISVSGNGMTVGGIFINHGTTLSMVPSASKLSIGSFPEFPPLTIKSHIYVANSIGQFIIHGHNLTAGGTIVDSGTTISLAPSATALVIGRITSLLSSSNPLLLPLTIRSHTYTVNSIGQFIIHGHTLTAGGTIFDSGTTISLAPSATALVIGSINELLSPSIPLLPLTVGSHTYTANSAGVYIIDGHTLRAGGVITDDAGTHISLALISASAVVIGSGTDITLTPTMGLGRLILQGFGEVSSATATDTTSAPPADTNVLLEGHGVKSLEASWLALEVFVLLLSMVAFLL